MEQQEIKLDQEISELDIEFVGELEEVTAGWGGPVFDAVNGNWSS